MSEDSLWDICRQRNEEARQRSKLVYPAPGSVDYTKPIPRKGRVRKSILIIFLVLAIVAALVLWLDWHFITEEMLQVWR